MANFKTTIIRKTRQQIVKRQYAASARQIVGRAGDLVRNTAVTSIQSGAKSGVVYEKYNPRRSHRASAAGQAPATDTGNLVNNIVKRVDGNGLGVDVESRANYSEALEFGTSTMAARPFLQPALEANRPKIRALEAQLFKAK